MYSARWTFSSNYHHSSWILNVPGMLCGQQGLSFPMYIILYTNRSEHYCFCWWCWVSPDPLSKRCFFFKPFPKLMKHKAQFTLSAFFPTSLEISGHYTKLNSLHFIFGSKCFVFLFLAPPSKLFYNPHSLALTRDLCLEYREKTTGPDFLGDHPET